MPSRVWAVHGCTTWCWHWSLKLSGTVHCWERPWLLTFDLFTTPPPLTWQRPGGGPRWNGVWGWLVPHTQEVGCVVVMGIWRNVIDAIVCLLVLTRLCWTIGIVCGLPVVFGQSFLESELPWGTGWHCCVCSRSFQLPVHWVYYMHILGIELTTFTRYCMWRL